MNNSHEQWNELNDEATRYPADLAGTEARFEKRLQQEKRKRRALWSSLTAAAASIAFVFLVNISAAFADTVLEIPVLGEIAEFVRFDKTLSHAIQNEYIQEVGLVAEDGEEKLLLPYLIADEHNLVLFFKLPEGFEQGPEEWITIRKLELIDRETGKDVGNYSYSSGSMSPAVQGEDHRFIQQNYKFLDQAVPKVMDLEVELKRDEKVLGTFNFSLTLSDFAAPRIYELNEKHRMFGQEIVVEDIAIYPTGTEVNFSFSEKNSALIKGLDLVLVQDKAIMLSGKVSGISATYLDDWMRVFIESAYFDKPQEQTLYIKGARLLDKDEVFITVDLDRKTMTPVIEGLELEEVMKDGEKASLIFSSPAENDHLYNVFANDYTDEEGNQYQLDNEGTDADGDIMRTYLTVKVPGSGKVILQRNFSDMAHLDESIVIKLPMK